MVRDELVLPTPVVPRTTLNRFLSGIPVLRFALPVVDLGNTIVHNSSKLGGGNFQGAKEGKVEWCVEI